MAAAEPFVIKWVCVHRANVHMTVALLTDRNRCLIGPSSKAERDMATEQN